MLTNAWLRAGFIALALGAGLLGPAAAQAQFEVTSCSIPLEPDKALAILRALSKGTTSSGVEQNGVRSGTRIAIRSAGGDRNAWTILAEVRSEFEFARRGAFRALSGTRTAQFARFALGVRYDAALGTLIAVADGEKARLFEYAVEPRPTRIEDPGSVRGPTAAQSGGALVSRGQLGPDYAAAGDPSETVSVGIQVQEARARGRRTLTAAALLPADLRLVLECDPAGTVRAGHELRLASELQLDALVRLTESGQIEFLRALSLNGGALIAERGPFPTGSLLGSFRFKAAGQGLSSAVVLDPRFLVAGGALLFSHRADLALEVDAGDGPLLAPAQVLFGQTSLCRTGRRC